MIQQSKEKVCSKTKCEQSLSYTPKLMTFMLQR